MMRFSKCRTATSLAILLRSVADQSLQGEAEEDIACDELIDEEDEE